VETETSADEALERVRRDEYDLVLVDLRLRLEDGRLLLEGVKEVKPSLLVVVLCASPSAQDVLDAFRRGGYDLLEKPATEQTVLDLTRRAMTVRKLGHERRNLAEALERERMRVVDLKDQLGRADPLKQIIGDSPTVHRLVDTLREVARTDSTVLLTGESGTGKGLMARTIHELSARGDGPFVQANCAVYAEGVLHSELFGHEKGAFTGAGRTKKGRFELGRGGTLFLDEIGDISPTTQVLLLRVLQDRTFERVGGEQTLEAEVRLIAATNRDLQKAMSQGRFREDLFYRLNVIPVHLPPLRSHPDDVPLLAQHYLSICSARLDRQVTGFSPEALDALQRYEWPGNVRELQNVVERAIVLNRSGTIEFEDMPESLRSGASRAATKNRPTTLRSMERGRILEALRETGGNKKKAAEILGIHRSSLYAKMRRHDLMSASEPSGERVEEDVSEVPEYAGSRIVR
jgi:two-component system response regulator HydG